MLLLFILYTRPSLFVKPATHGAVCTVQPLGMPSAPVVQPVMPAAWVKVPLEATPLSQLLVQLLALMSVARQVTLLRLVQPENMLI